MAFKIQFCDVLQSESSGTLPSSRETTVVRPNLTSKEPQQSAVRSNRIRSFSFLGEKGSIKKDMINCFLANNDANLKMLAVLTQILQFRPQTIKIKKIKSHFPDCYEQVQLLPVHFLNAIPDCVPTNYLMREAA